MWDSIKRHSYRTRQEYFQERGLFDSSREEEDDDDEDYSMNEDMIKNQKKYQSDEAWLQRTNIVVPKKEIQELIADQVKEFPMNTKLGGT